MSREWHIKQLLNKARSLRRYEHEHIEYREVGEDHIAVSVWSSVESERTYIANIWVGLFEDFYKDSNWKEVPDVEGSDPGY